MTSMCSPIRSKPFSSWLDVMTGDKSLIDPRTLEVHQVLFNDPTPQRSLRHFLPPVSPRYQRTFVANWVEKNTLIWESEGFEPVPIDDVDDDDGDELLDVFHQPLQLESCPPFPKQNAMNSLLGPQNRRRRKSVFTERTDDHGYQSFGNALPQPHVVVDVPSSSSSYYYSDSDEQRDLPAGQLIADKVRRACQSLRTKLS